MSQSSKNLVIRPCKTCGTLVKRWTGSTHKEVSCSMWCSSYDKAKRNYEKTQEKLKSLKNKGILIEILSFPLVQISHNKVHMRYKLCGHEEHVIWHHFIKRQKNTCIHKECLHKDLWEFMYEKFNGELLPLTNPKNPMFFDECNVKERKVLVYHKPCDTQRVISYGTIFNLKTGVACPICQSKQRVEKSLSRYKEIFPQEWLENNEILEITAISKPILVKHKTCGFIHYLTAATIKGNPKYCENCTPNILKTKEYWNSEFQKHEINYEVVEYTNHYNGVIKCLACNNVFKGAPYHFIHGNAKCECQKTSRSKGEQAVESALKELGINFQIEKSFPECRDKHALPFDFAVYKDSDFQEVTALIEYEGKQHFEPIEYFGGEKAFKAQVRRDGIKRKWAKESNIPLLEIPYTVKFHNIKKVVQDFLEAGK